jgi:hypothetical protein
VEDKNGAADSRMTSKPNLTAPQLCEGDCHRTAKQLDFACRLQLLMRLAKPVHREIPSMDTKEGKVTASVEEIASYNLVLTEAIYELLADKGFISKEEVLERVQKLKSETTINFRRVQ